MVYMVFGIVLTAFPFLVTKNFMVLSNCAVNSAVLLRF